MRQTASADAYGASVHATRGAPMESSARQRLLSIENVSGDTGETTVTAPSRDDDLMTACGHDTDGAMHAYARRHSLALGSHATQRARVAIAPSSTHAGGGGCVPQTSEVDDAVFALDSCWGAAELSAVLIA